MSLLRHLKYTLGADVLDLIVQATPLADGQDSPPSIINFAGGGDFHAVGDHTVDLLVREAHLQRGERILDVGSAIGRNALALHRRFGGSIDYAGFDIVRYGVAWCRKWAARETAAYRFDHADLYNPFYNPRGKGRAAEHQFPYDDDSFDISVATSVYTHMTGPEIARYLSETARVTVSGGRLYATVFVWDDAARKAADAGQTAFRFSHQGDGVQIESQSEPTLAVAVEASALEHMLKDAGARAFRILPGQWRGGPGADFQDLLIAEF
jgi:SAM-dependent methyltransferase